MNEGPTCPNDPERTCSKGACVLAKCRIDVATFQRETCGGTTSQAIGEQCEAAILPCSSAGEQCKFLACVDRGLGNFSDGRIKMVGQ